MQQTNRSRGRRGLSQVQGHTFLVEAWVLNRGALRSMQWKQRKQKSRLHNLYNNLL